MNIQNLKCFLVTTETLNFTKTGEQLFLSQQGVSRVINSLEKELDVPLFVRSKHALSLTPYGAAFKETASEILKQYDYFLERVEELKEEKKKLLRLIIPTGIDVYKRQSWILWINLNLFTDMTDMYRDRIIRTQSLLIPDTFINLFD